MDGPLSIATSWRVVRDLCSDLLPKMLANLRRHWDNFFWKNWHVAMQWCFL